MPMLMKFLGLGCLLLCCSGASCRPWGRPAEPGIPVAFAGPPTLEDLLYTVNTNSSRIQQLSTEDAKLTMSGESVGLKASLAMDRPRRLRLRGKFIAQELDIGSNDELLWFWAKRDPTEAVYYAYHEQFALVNTNTVLPVSPDWIVEAFGLVTLDPSTHHEGPFPRPDGSLELRSRLNRQGTQLTRMLVIDSKHGVITEQHLFDATGHRVATARCGNYRFYSEAGSSLPHRIQIELPTAQLAFQIEVDKFTLNQLLGDANELFKLPHYDGYRLINLAQPASVPVGAPEPRPSVYAPPSPLGQTPPTSHAQEHTAYRLKYRGFVETR